MFHPKLHRNILRDSPVGIDKRRLKRELRKVWACTTARQGATRGSRLINAFMWSDSPQGVVFWLKHA